jgi:hypothetical protein
MLKVLSFLGIDSVWNWLRPTVEGEDGKSSARRITAFIVTALYVLGNIQVFYIIKDTSLVMDVLILDAVFILVLFGIITIQNILTFFKMKNENKNI